MFKRVFNRIRLNFRQSRSDRAGTVSYRNYHQQVQKLFTKVTNFRKVNKDYDKS